MISSMITIICTIVIIICCSISMKKSDETIKRLKEFKKEKFKMSMQKCDKHDIPWEYKEIDLNEGNAGGSYYKAEQYCPKCREEHFKKVNKVFVDVTKTKPPTLEELRNQHEYDMEVEKLKKKFNIKV